MTVRLSPDGSLHERIDPGGAAASGARAEGALARATGAPGCEANPDVKLCVGGMTAAGGRGAGRGATTGGAAR